MNTTTKRFHRTLSAAFPQDHTAAIFLPYRRTRMEFVKDGALAVVIGLGLAWWTAGWWLS